MLLPLFGCLSYKDKHTAIYYFFSKKIFLFYFFLITSSNVALSLISLFNYSSCDLLNENSIAKDISSNKENCLCDDVDVFYDHVISVESPNALGETKLEIFKKTVKIGQVNSIKKVVDIPIPTTTQVRSDMGNGIRKSNTETAKVRVTFENYNLFWNTPGFHQDGALDNTCGSFISNESIASINLIIPQ